MEEKKTLFRQDCNYLSSLDINRLQGRTKLIYMSEIFRLLRGQGTCYILIKGQGGKLVSIL